LAQATYQLIRVGMASGRDIDITRGCRSISLLLQAGNSNQTTADNFDFAYLSSIYYLLVA
jgi:hypothetical protein